MTSPELQTKLAKLPRSPGVYFHKDTDGEVIYVGKAAVLKNRVRQYFQSSRGFDSKTQSLVGDIADVDWIETESEIDALFLESEMVKRYMPRYNILLRDDKSQIYVRINTKDEWPTVTCTRHPLDDNAEYIGPFYNSHAVKKALRYLRRIFPYYEKSPKVGERPDLHAHIGLAPLGMTSAEYKVNLRKLKRYIAGGGASLIRDLERDMTHAAKRHDYETAATLRNKLYAMKELKRRIMFGDKEAVDISSDIALSDLTELLGLKALPARIEGYDISHMSGTNVVASMVVFINGVSNRSEYRKFKTHRERNDDFANMKETLLRRFRESNIKSWGKPDLLLIDGGKGQLDAALTARDLAGANTPCIGLAKREEQIVIDNCRSNVTLNDQKLANLHGRAEKSNQYTLLSIPHSADIIKLLQRIRDESHRFAVSYHSTLKTKKATSSVIEEIPGIGPATRRKLLRAFGSVNGIKQAPSSEISLIVGVHRAQIIAKYLHE